MKLLRVLNESERVITVRTNMDIERTRFNQFDGMYICRDFMFYVESALLSDIY